MFKRTKRIITSVAVLGGLSLAGVTASMVVGATPAFATACAGQNQQQASVALVSNDNSSYYLGVDFDGSESVSLYAGSSPYMWELCWTVDGGNGVGGSNPYWGTFYLYNQTTGDFVRNNHAYNNDLTADSIFAGTDELFYFSCQGGNGLFLLDHNSTGHYPHYDNSWGGEPAVENVYPAGTLDKWINFNGSGFCY